MVIQENMSIQRKLEVLSDAAKYDVACTSSGVDRKGNGTSMGNSVAGGICHSFSADGRCISLLNAFSTVNIAPIDPRTMLSGLPSLLKS
jgi:predicted DNA-binding helix-hairpin-helix protein